MTGVAAKDPLLIHPNSIPSSRYTMRVDAVLVPSHHRPPLWMLVEFGSLRCTGPSGVVAAIVLLTFTGLSSLSAQSVRHSPATTRDRTASSRDTSGGGDPGSYLGVNCGKSGAHDTKQGIENYFIKRNVATLNLAADLGLGWARCGGGPEQWYRNDSPSPAAFDEVVRHANSKDIRVYLFLEYRGDINPQAITDFDWRRVGIEFATHFGNRVACYGILNEVDHVASPHSPAEVAFAVDAFASGVHDALPAANVASPSIGGTPMQVQRADEFLAAIGPLFHDGKLSVLNLHSYHDSRPHKPHESNIDDSSDWAPSRNFLRAVEKAGIDRPLRFAAGEFNYRNWDGTDADRGIGFMTALWDQLMVVAATAHDHDADPQRVGLFSIPYNLPDDRPERQTTMAVRFDWQPDGSYQWTGNEKGRVLQSMVRLTDGMSFVACDPLDRGFASLRGPNRTAWVWHHRKAFSSLATGDDVELTGVPSAAKQMVVIDHTGLAIVRRSIADPSKTSLRLSPSELPPNQTLLIMVDAADPAVVPSMGLAR